MSNAAKSNGGPAFPALCDFDTDGKLQGHRTANSSGWEMGMTLRDYFAAMALQGILASAGTINNVDDPHDGTPDVEWRDAAHEAYLYADAMLVERSQ